MVFGERDKLTDIIEQGYHGQLNDPTDNIDTKTPTIITDTTTMTNIFPKRTKIGGMGTNTFPK